MSEASVNGKLLSYFIFLWFLPLAFSWAGRPSKRKHVGSGDRECRKIKRLALEGIVSETEHSPGKNHSKFLCFNLLSELTCICQRRSAWSSGCLASIATLGCQERHGSLQADAGVGLSSLGKEPHCLKNPDREALPEWQSPKAQRHSSKHRTGLWTCCHELIQVPSSE